MKVCFSASDFDCVIIRNGSYQPTYVITITFCLAMIIQSLNVKCLLCLQIEGSLTLDSNHHFACKNQKTFFAHQLSRSLFLHDSTLHK